MGEQLAGNQLTRAEAIRDTVVFVTRADQTTHTSVRGCGVAGQARREMEQLRKGSGIERMEVKKEAFRGKRRF